LARWAGSQGAGSSVAGLFGQPGVVPGGAWVDTLTPPGKPFAISKWEVWQGPIGR
jgi:hypothetical protein